MPSIDGSCVCGAVTVTVARTPRKLTQCNCSTCRRYRTLWCYFRRREVKIAGKLREIRLRPRGMRYLTCAKCTCMIAWQYARGPEARMGLNSGLLDPEVMAKVRISLFDGSKTWRVVEKYTKPALWLSPVRTLRAGANIADD